MGIIYLITSDIDGKVYVGQTVDTLSRRWKHHLDNAKKVKPDGDLGKDIKYFGEENFHIEQLATADTQKELDRLEEYYITQYDAIEHGYNIRHGGKQGKELGLPIQEICNEYANNKIGCQTLAALYNCSPSTIHTILKENGVKLRTQLGGPKDMSSKKRKIEQLNKDTEEVIAVYDSMTDAGVALGDKNKYKHISDVCRGVRKTAYGYKWRYKEEN